MNQRTLLLFAVMLAVWNANIEARKTSGGRNRGGSSYGGRVTHPHPAPTSFHQSAPSHSGGNSLQNSYSGGSYQSPGRQPSHSYPNSATGLSGNQPPSYQQSVQQSHSYPQNSKPQQTHTYPQNNAQPGQNNPSGHSYPSSNTGLSGSGGAGAKYPANSGGGHQAGGYGNNYHQQAPPPYSPPVYNNPVYNRPQYSNPVYNRPQYSNPGYGHGGYGGGYGGGHGGYGSYGGYNGIGNFGGYNYGGMRRGTSTLTKVGIAGASIGTVLTGLALWNLARSGNSHSTRIYQDHRGNPIPMQANQQSTSPFDPLLSELVNCTLTISGSGETEVISIPCAIATSFSPTSDLNKGVDKSDSTQDAKCTVTVVKKDGTELSTTIPCSIFLNTAKQANVTEPPPLAENGTDIQIGAGIPQPYVPVASNAQGAPYSPGVPNAPDAPNTPGASVISPNYSQSLPQQPVGIGPLPNEPLAPYPNQQPVNQGGAGYLAPYPNPVGLPYGAPLQLPSCKLEPGATQDPLSPCLPAAGAVTPPPTSASSAAYSAAAATLQLKVNYVFIVIMITLMR